MLRATLLAGSLLVLAACGRPEVQTANTQPQLSCPTARQYMKLTDEEVQGYIAQGCEFTCPRTTGKRTRRYQNRLTEEELLRTRNRGCELHRRSEDRLSAWVAEDPQ